MKRPALSVEILDSRIAPSNVGLVTGIVAATPVIVVSPAPPINFELVNETPLPPMSGPTAPVAGPPVVGK